MFWLIKNGVSMRATSTNKISLLDHETRELIAAGEVIERPLSALKELIENSIDAGSAKITIELKNGGHSRIAITDDGCGMSRDDVLTSLQRFATSKIKKIDDLEHLTTLGFRGEALPSIAAVSKMEIFTNDNSGNLGTHLYIEGGKILTNKETALPKGTKIIVDDLFFNIPARRKFQKASTTEFTQIFNLVYKFALYYKNIHFVMTHNDKEVLNLPYQLDNLTKFSRFLKQDNDIFTAVEAQSSYLKINGFISSPAFTKKNKDGQIIFINGRIIKPNLINQAINDAYSQFTERGQFSFALLFIDIDPKEIDVNVHPAKSEVRFSDTSLVYKAVFNTVLQKLKQTSKPLARDFEFSAYQSGGYSYNKQSSYQDMTMPLDYGEEETLGARASGVTEKPEIFGQINQTYAFGVINNEIILIDTHAAHERINYEYFKNRLTSKDAGNQKLLTPVTIELTKDQQNILNKEKEIFEKLGFEIEEFGQDSFIVRAVPQKLETENIKTFLTELLTELEDEYFKYKSADETTDNLIKSIACKASLKSGKQLNYYEIKRLFEDLNKTQIPSNCPHGRPTFVKFGNKELGKMFKRQA